MDGVRLPTMTDSNGTAYVMNTISNDIGPYVTEELRLLSIARTNLLRWISRVPGLLPLLRRRALRDPLANALRSIPDSALAGRTLAHPLAGPLLRAVLASTLHQTARRLPGTIRRRPPSRS